jgi:hypothetical protein
VLCTPSHNTCSASRRAKSNRRRSKSSSSCGHGQVGVKHPHITAHLALLQSVHLATAAAPPLQPQGRTNAATAWTDSSRSQTFQKHCRLEPCHLQVLLLLLHCCCCYESLSLPLGRCCCCQQRAAALTAAAAAAAAVVLLYRSNRKVCRSRALMTVSLTPKAACRHQRVPDVNSSRCK